MDFIRRIKGVLPGGPETPPARGGFVPPDGPADLEAMYNPEQPTDDPLVVPFDPAAQKVYCSFDGRELVPGGHMFREYLMCPQHGEFTIAPIVTRYKDGWAIHFRDETERSMWETCQHLSSTDSPDGAAQVGAIADDTEYVDRL